MSAELKTKRLTPEEYLAVEEKAEYKSEYWDGAMVPLHGEPPALVGAKVDHVQIVSNLTEILSSKLKKQNCRTFSSDLKIWIVKRNKFLYPGLAIICGKLKFYRERRDVVTNPRMIVEVLSESTASNDRTDKLWAYQTLESVQECVLISQDKPIVEQYSRNSDNWLYQAAIGIESSVTFSSIETTLTLKRIYDLVEFEA